MHFPYFNVKDIIINEITFFLYFNLDALLMLQLIFCSHN